MISIRDAVPADAVLIRSLAEQTWWPAYADILTEGQIRYMLADIYDPARIAAQISTGDQHYILLGENGTEKGFAAFSPRADDPDVYKLHKIYCLPETRGKGYGRLLIDEVAGRVQQAGKSMLDLNVNRSNPAKGFYEKMGFTVIREEDIPIGPYFMNDFVMRKIC